MAAHWQGSPRRFFAPHRLLECVEDGRMEQFGQAIGAAVEDTRLTAALEQPAGDGSGKTVTVQPRTTDRYGRTVANVTIAGTDVSLALVQAGMAWHFLRYSEDPKLAAAEREARTAHRGLWADPSPVAPWSFRLEQMVAAPVVFHGNGQSRVFHAASCPYYRCKNCTTEFATAEAAQAAGFRPHSECTRSRE
jgi:hypothetical protein